MIYISFLIGVVAGGLIMAIFSASAYQKGWEDGKQDN